MAKVKTLLFDFDGTLMDTTNVIMQSWQQVYKTVTGKEGDERVILDTFGSMLKDALKEAFPEESNEKLLKIYRKYQYDNFLDLVEFYPGVERMLEKVSGRVEHMALVTSRLKNTTTQAVEKFRLDRYFDVVVTADDCTEHKPDPQPVNLALEWLGAEPEGAMMVGDTLFDRECSRRAGVQSALVSWAPSIDVHSLNGSDVPDHILERPDDIFKII